MQSYLMPGPPTAHPLRQIESHLPILPALLNRGWLLQPLMAPPAPMVLASLQPVAASAAYSASVESLACDFCHSPFWNWAKRPPNSN